MNKDEIQHALKTAQSIALEAGEILKKYWGNLHHIERKTFAWDLVTEADKESEKLIRERINASFPHHNLLCEESGLTETEETDYLWCVDPLDGTTNYTHQYPMVSVSIALLEKGNPLVGVIYNPVHNELFSAGLGLGAQLNGQKIAVSTVEDLETSLLVTGFSYDRKTAVETNYREFCYLTHLTQGVRRGGSAALDLAYVAAGRVDGYWERGLQPWDIAAGTLIVQEAGGLVTLYNKEPIDLFSGKILATNKKIHTPLSDAIQQAKTANFPH